MGGGGGSNLRWGEVNPNLCSMADSKVAIFISFQCPFNQKILRSVALWPTRFTRLLFIFLNSSMEGIVVP